MHCREITWPSRSVIDLGHQKNPNESCLFDDIFACIVEKLGFMWITRVTDLSYDQPCMWIIKGSIDVHGLTAHVHRSIPGFESTSCRRYLDPCCRSQDLWTMQIPQQYLKPPNHPWPNPFKIFPARLDGIKGSQWQNNAPSGSPVEWGTNGGERRNSGGRKIMEADE